MPPRVLVVVEGAHPEDVVEVVEKAGLRISFFDLLVDIFTFRTGVDRTFAGRVHLKAARAGVRRCNSTRRKEEQGEGHLSSRTQEGKAPMAASPYPSIYQRASGH